MSFNQVSMETWFLKNSKILLFKCSCQINADLCECENVLTAVKLIIKQVFVVIVVIAFNHWFRLIIVVYKKKKQNKKNEKFMRGTKGRKRLGRHG